MYKTVLFDLDGTLTDPKEGITKSVQYALKKYGIEVPDLDSLEKFIGPPLKDSFSEYYGFTEDQSIEAIEYYREYFSRQGIFENRVYRGIPELLEKLNDSGLVMAVATSKPTVFAEQILDHFNMAGYFRAIAGSNLDNTRSNKAEVIAFVLDEMKTPAADAVMVGDRVHDLIGAGRNGMDFIGVLYGYGTAEEFTPESPRYIVDDVDSLSSVLMS